MQIYTRAVKANPLNVTLWTSYILFLLKKVNKNLPKSNEKIQGVFKEAVDACGMEFRSDELWSLYLEHETKRGNFREVLSLYNRVLNIPTQRYQMHFERCQILVSTRSPVEFLTMEELNTIHKKVHAENDDDLLAEEDLPSGDIADSLTEGDLKKIQQLILDTRKQMYLLNKEQVEKRSLFEDGIKRLYFFATPLSVKQLQNWRKYLDFEVSQGQHERVVILYERCLMPCAMYEEFWLSYARYMESHSVEAARSVFERACLIHLPVKFTLHLQWALFEEKHGQLDSVRAIFCNLENVLPGVVMVRLRRVNFERRNGNLQEAERLLREAAQNSFPPEIASFYSVKLARLLLKLRRDPEKAREVLIEALKKEPNSPYLHQSLLEIEISRDAADDVMLCVERALDSNIHDAMKEILSQRRLEFMEDCGSSIKSLFMAYDEHQILLKRQEFLKRKARAKDNKDEKNKKAKTQSADHSVEDKFSTPGVPQPAMPSVMSEEGVSTTSTTVSSTEQTPSVAPSVVPEEGVSTTTTVSSTEKTIVKSTTPIAKGQVSTPRPTAQPYGHSYRAPRFTIIPSFARGHGPPPRMSFPSQMPPHHMGGPPQPIPPYNYGQWFQNFRGLGGQLPWNPNRFFPPY